MAGRKPSLRYRRTMLLLYFFALNATASLFLPFRIHTSEVELNYYETTVYNGYVLLFANLSVLFVLISVFLMRLPMRKRKLSFALALSFLNIPILFGVYEEVFKGHFGGYETNAGIGMPYLMLCVLAITIIVLSRILNIKNFFQGKHEYEELIDNGYQKLDF